MSRPDLIPEYVLYGEAPSGELPDLVHIEALKDRSRLHDWEIRPHRHAGLLQILHFQTPEVEIRLDGAVRHTSTPSILLVPPNTVHGFRFAPDISGSVTTIPVHLLEERPDHVPALIEAPVLMADTHRAFADLKQILTQIEDEYHARRPARAEALGAFLSLIAIWIRRLGQNWMDPDAKGPGRSAPEIRVNKFLDLVESRYASGARPEAYADTIGISTGQLTRDCRTLLGRSPLQVIHDRIIREAQRKLAYTPWSVAQIGEELGFADIGYFSRFFRQRTGETPSGYRNRMSGKISRG